MSAQRHYIVLIAWAAPRGPAPYPPTSRASGLVGPSVIAVKRQTPRFDEGRGSCDAAGYFYHKHRSDELIISAGWTLSAAEIEHTRLTHVLVVEAAVIGVPDILWGGHWSGGWRGLCEEREWLGGY
jgi:hypothetical protein